MNINDMENSVVTDPYLATVGTKFGRWAVLHLSASVNKLQASSIANRTFTASMAKKFWDLLDCKTEAPFCSLKLKK